MPVFCLVPMATDIGCDDEAAERSSVFYPCQP